MVVLYALVRIEQNSSKIVILAVNEHFLVGNAFATNGELGYITTTRHNCISITV